MSSCHTGHKVIFYDWASTLFYIQCGHFIVSLNRFIVVSIFTRLHAERSGVQFPALIRFFFSSLKRPDGVCGPPNLLLNLYRRALSLGVKAAWV